MKNKNIFISFIIKILVFLVFGVLFYSGLFEKLDFRLYDSLIAFRKEPEANKNIMLVKIDDPSIKELGEWPWGRDIIADALLRMKELGADSAIFDIEYISPTKNGIAPSAEEKIFNQVYATEETVNSLIGQLSNAIESGYISKEEVPLITFPLSFLKKFNTLLNVTIFFDSSSIIKLTSTKSSSPVSSSSATNEFHLGFLPSSL